MQSTRRWMTSRRLTRAALGAALLTIAPFAATTNAAATFPTTDASPGITAPPSATPAA